MDFEFFHLFLRKYDLLLAIIISHKIISQTLPGCKTNIYYVFNTYLLLGTMFLSISFVSLIISYMCL